MSARSSASGIATIGIATVAVVLGGCGGGGGGGPDAGLPRDPAYCHRASSIDAGLDEAGTRAVIFPERDFFCEPGSVRPCATECGAGPLAARGAIPGEELDDATLTFVIDRLSLPEHVGPRAAGFNLDGMDSAGGSTARDADCEEYNQDWVALSDPHVGVDNAMEQLVGTIEGSLDASRCPSGEADGCLDFAIEEQMRAGSMILLVEVSGIDSLRYDPSVEVQLFRAAVPGTAVCGAAADCLEAGGDCVAGECRPAPALRDRRLAAGQAFEVLEAFGEPVAGDIFEGRLRASPLRLTIPIENDDFSLPLAITGAEVRFDIRASGLMSGQMGGVVAAANLAETLGSMRGLCFLRWHCTDEELRASARNIVFGIADIHPSAEEPAICDLVSVGLAFEATTADRI